MDFFFGNRRIQTAQERLVECRDRSHRRRARDLFEQQQTMHEDIGTVNREAVRDVAEARDDVRHRRGVRREVRMHMFDAALRKHARQVHRLWEQRETANQRPGTNHRPVEKDQQNFEVTRRMLQHRAQIAHHDGR